jgi:myo-inositol-1(or 4)-monophosphatase
MHPMLNIAIKAARKAGGIIMRGLNDLDRIQVEEKGLNDFFSEIDRQAEQVIIETILRAYPDHAVLGEEGGQQGASECLWIIDPLDGTTNFLHGFPHFAVSIAFSYRQTLAQAVVFDPVKNELFTASKGEGAMLNDRRIRVSKTELLLRALLGTGFPFRQFSHFDEYLHTLASFMKTTAGIRRPGAAALDLAYVAAGRLDGFWEYGLNPWDMAAGALLVKEAGGLVADFEGEDQFLDKGMILAANPKIFNQMIQALKKIRQG